MIAVRMAGLWIVWNACHGLSIRIQTSECAVPCEGESQHAGPPDRNPARQGPFSKRSARMSGR